MESRSSGNPRQSLSLHRPPHGAHGTNQGAIATHAHLRTDGGTSNTQSRSENVVLLAAHCRLAFKSLHDVS
ncbi:MAG: hypothetical protein KGL42_14615, partial [Betaproteobacteria bacterium]|nr:hypothetical protein [Betaproteobacteria bacterium]